ncbi:MAG: restriction endonuclease [Anaerolineae bacterium]|nr:restriction endonuclease [Anaerolineae bacterium]
MAVPDYQSIMLPLLQFAGDKQEHSLRETIEALAEVFSLSDEDRKQLLPSGRQATFDNRVGWARTYLAKAGLLQTPRRGYYRISDQGLKVLQQKPGKIDNAFLRQYPEFIAFQAKRVMPEETDNNQEDDSTKTPEEIMEEAYQQVRQDLATELLEMVRDYSPAFFERLVVDLLVKMGYGGTRKEAGKAIGTSGDEGIDGIINEDRLGLDIVYIQAKRWQNTVTRPEIQKFAGALQGQRAKKGIFITTSNFSDGARDYVSRIDSKIVLIDGDTLSQLMIDYNVGVNTVASYDLKRIDLDYFTEA